MPLFTLADVVSLNHDQGEVYNIMNEKNGKVQNLAFLLSSQTFCI
jgi:hypothetical protein